MTSKTGTMTPQSFDTGPGYTAEWCMEARSAFRNLSPLDHRYYEANPELFSRLSDYLSEEAAVRFCVQVEAALLHSHMRRTGMDTPANREAVDRLSAVVRPDAVYAAERETRHNIRALVRVIKQHLPEPLVSLVHLGATSVDILDTAASLRIRGVVRSVLLPVLLGVEDHLLTLARTHAGSLQIGRTHGQHAVPITFGYALSEYVVRLGKSIEQIHERAGDLRGKLSGAVGAYNSMSMIVADPIAFERECLSLLGIEPGDHATQMVEPEYLLRLLLEINTAFGILANLADDLRNLQRTEIDEVREFFTSDQVGSSTMPQKRNPWNSEHVKSLWKAFAPRVITFFSDQISEHQRDLTNSASGRFVADFLAGFAAAAARMQSVLGSLHVNVDRMRSNAALTGDMPLAEAAYSLLATTGRSDAHEDVRKATLDAQTRGVTLRTALRERPELWDAIGAALAEVSTLSPDEYFSDAANYAGQAQRVALDITQEYRSRIESIREGLKE